MNSLQELAALDELDEQNEEQLLRVVDARRGTMFARGFQYLGWLIMIGYETEGQFLYTRFCSFYCASEIFFFPSATNFAYTKQQKKIHFF